MEIIKQNPYRVLGVLADSSERELQKQLAIIKRYSEVGKSKTFGTDFNFIGDVSRSTEDVLLAASKIEQAHKKVHYALFWFVSVNNFDEIAFNNLKEEGRGKAIEIWNKTLKDGISSKNYSSYHNLSTLYIASSLIGGKLDIELMRMGIELKGELLKSDFLHSFLKLIGGNGVSVDPEMIGRQFVDDIIEIVDPLLLGHNVRGKSKRIIALFNRYPGYIKKYLIEKYTEIPFSSIESEISKAEEKRKENPAKSIGYGEVLYDSARGDIAFLRLLLGGNDIQLQMIADKLADELMLCSIGYFNEWIETDDIDSGADILKITEYAKSIGPSGRVKQRMDKNIEIMRARIEDKPHQQQQDNIAAEMNYLASKLQDFPDASVTMVSVNDLLRSCRPKLRAIKDEFGSTDEYYLNISDVVVSCALGGLIDIFNSAQDKAVTGVANIETVKNLARSVISTIDTINRFDMSAPVRARVNKNRKIIAEIESQVARAVQNDKLPMNLVIDESQVARAVQNSKKYMIDYLETPQVARAAQKSSYGCYVATMTYGDYDHPQVLILRRYRDHVLSKTIFGRLFIKIYYATSPYLVKALSNRTGVNTVIRKLLDKWAEVIER